MTREQWLTLIKKVMTDIDDALDMAIKKAGNDAVFLYELIENNETKLEESSKLSRPKGKWINEHENGHGFWFGTCSQCGKEKHVDNYCGNCGAEMESEE